MPGRRALIGAICSLLLSIGAVTATSAPAQAAAIGCVNAVGICDSHFCAFVSFGHGNWWFAFLGGEEETDYWNAYYYAGDKFVFYAEVSPTGC